MKFLTTHSGRLERWLGNAVVEELSAGMRSWYGPPIPVGSVPGHVWAHRGGEFSGPIHAGHFCSAIDYAANRLTHAIRRWTHGQFSVANTGFASLADLIAEATAGKTRLFPFQKSGSAGVVGVTNSLWGLGTQPAAGANAAAAPGGEAPTDATTGAFLFVNPTSPDTQHFVYGVVQASLANTLLLYDRIFQVNKTMASTATEAVTGVPTRYQGSVGAADSPEGNFLFVEVGTPALSATAHNWTVCLYTDQAAGASTLPSLTGNASAIVRRLDHPVMQWFAPLAAGDSGIKTLTQMQCSASIAAGVINFVIGHPIVWLPVPLVNVACVTDGIYTAFNLARVFDDAALAFLEVSKPATTATNYNGCLRTVAG